MTTENKTLKKLAALCASKSIELSLAYNARTVTERDVWDMFKRGDCPRFVWTYSLNVRGRSLKQGTYSAGYGESIYANSRKTTDVCAAIAAEISIGKLFTKAREYQGYSWPRPPKEYPLEPMAVMACLFSDAGCVEGRTFEEFCGELGYDDDSIKAKKIYDECIETYMVLKSAFGDQFSTAYELALEY